MLDRVRDEPHVIFEFDRVFNNLPIGKDIDGDMNLRIFLPESVEDLPSRGCLKLLDLFGHGRLGDIEGLRCCTEAPIFDGKIEDSQLIKVQFYNLWPLKT